jgi:hypothetical protein
MSFFDRYSRFFDTSGIGTRLPDGSRSPRLSYRYKAIIERNQALFAGARVLDLASHDGRWSLAALDSGAASVTGIEGRQLYVSAAYRLYDRIPLIKGCNYDRNHRRLTIQVTD